MVEWEVCFCCSYHLAESVDGQLRRMEQDLKEIIEQMNSSNAAEDEESPVRYEFLFCLSFYRSLLLSECPVCIVFIHIPDGEGGEDP